MRCRAHTIAAHALLFAVVACSDAPTGPAADADSGDALSPDLSAQVQEAAGAPEPIQF